MYSVDGRAGEGEREKGIQTVAYISAVGPRAQDLDLGRELGQDLTACAAGPGGLVRGNCNCVKRPRSLADCFEYRRSFRAVCQSE